MINKISKNKGFSLVEILVATSIIVVSILAVMTVTQKSVSMSRRALHTLQASFLLEEGAEATRIVRDNAWANISALNAATDYYPAFSSGTWTLSTTASQVGIFTRKVNVASVSRNDITGEIDPTGTDDPLTKLITVTVSWDEGGDILSKTLSFYIMDIFS